MKVDDLRIWVLMYSWQHSRISKSYWC